MKWKVFNALGMAAFSCIALSTSSHAVDLNLGIQGGNFSAWSTMGECASTRPGEGCTLLAERGILCEMEIYVTNHTYQEMHAAIRAGKSISVNTMNNGQFGRLVCTLNG